MIWIAAALLVVAFWLHAFVAWNVDFLRPWLWFAAGTLIGGALADGHGFWAYAASGTASSVVIFAVVVRALPIHNSGWEPLDGAVFTDGKTTFALTNAEDLERFHAFFEKGSFRSMLKSGYGWEAELSSGGHTWRLYLHGDGVGHRPGGISQTIFVPSEPGFRAWFEALAARHAAL